MSGKGKDWVFKIVILGDTAVGKTSLIYQYVESKFKEDYKETMGVNILVKTVKIGTTNVRLLLWDIAGQSKYESSRGKFFEGCIGALMVYDITRYSSFENIELIWLRDFHKYALSEKNYILIGNKMDLEGERGVYKEDAQKFANRIEAIDFIETSAKIGENVNTAFHTLVKHILKSHGVDIE